MKLNIANPKRGLQKCVDLSKTSEMKLYEKRMGDIFNGSLISSEFEGYILKITGGDDHQGFPMKNKLNTTRRVRLLLKDGEKGYRCRRDGCRRRKSVRGMIVSSEISVLACIIIQEESNVVEGLSDAIVEQSHLPKRASKLRKMFGVDENADLLKTVREVVKNGLPADRKMPRIRIVGLKDEKKEAEKENQKKERLLRKEKNEALKKNYIAKFGAIKL